MSSGPTLRSVLLEDVSPTLESDLVDVVLESVLLEDVGVTLETTFVDEEE